MQSPSRFLDRQSPPALLTLILMAGVATLSMNMFLPSLPRMAEWFGTDYAVIQFAVSGYMAFTAVVQLLVGPLSDRYGRRPVMLTGLGVFVLASVACVFAPTIETFMAARMVQAVIASGLVLSRAVVRDIATPEKSASMMGYVTMGMALMPMIGPTLGGTLEQLAGWQSNFWALIVFGSAVFVLCWFDMGETNRTLTASLTEQFRAYPELVRSRRFWGYALTTAFSAGVFYAFLGGAPYVADQVLGIEPIELGYWFACVPFGFMMGSFLSGRYSMRVGIDRMIVFGNLAIVAGIAASCLLFASGVNHPAALFVPACAIGVGNGLTMANATAGSLAVRPHLAGSAAGLGGGLMVGGGAVLSALPGVFLRPEWGAFPLLFVMLGSALMACVSTAYVIWVSARQPLAPGDMR